MKTVENKNMKTKVTNIQALLAKYEDELAGFHVMEDYDGGQYAMLRKVIDDLKGLQQRG